MVGFFPGVWDLLHLGHMRALQEAKGKCRFLIVGVNKTPQKKHQPILSCRERLELLKHVRWVDAIIPYQNEEELKSLDVIFNGIRFMGADHKKDKKYPTSAKIVYISRDHNYSSTNLKKRIWKKH